MGDPQNLEMHLWGNARTVVQVAPSYAELGRVSSKRVGEEGWGTGEPPRFGQDSAT